MELTRRGFFCASALAATAAASSGCINIAHADEVVWDKEADIVVLGAGSGMLAALRAALNGQRVILLDKRPVVGGAMRFSGGNAWLCNTTYSQENGDSYELSKAYLDHMLMGYDMEDIVEAYLANTQAVVDTFEEANLGLKPLPRDGSYQRDWEGGSMVGRSCQVMGDNDGSDFSEAGGARLSDALEGGLAATDAEIMLESSGDSLVTVRDSSDAVPRVVGILATDSNGSKIAIRAQKGVILATGGFEWNEEYVRTFSRVPLYGGISWDTNVGDALRMSMSVGAQLSLMGHSFGMPNFKAHYDYAKDNGGMISMAGNMARTLPGSIMVDRTARRFCDEAAGYMSTNNAFGGYFNYGDQGYSCDPAWWICDRTCYETYGGPCGQVLAYGYPAPDLPEEDWVYQADTLEGLAEIIGVDAVELTRTVEQFNEHAAQGADPLFHRGEVGWGGSDPMPPKPLETAPYYACAMVAGCCGTIGGPRLNEHAQVLHVSGQPIEGLYACGNCAGVGGPGPSYGGEGGTLGPAFVFGVIAANHASARGE